MAQVFVESSDEVDEILVELIEEDFPQFRTFGVRVRTVMNDDRDAKGKRIASAVKKKSGLDAFLAIKSNEDFFVIILSKTVWDKLTETRIKRALLDECLRQCGIEDDDKGNLKLSILKPDAIMFKENIEKYGLWHDSMKELAKVIIAHQGELPFEQSA